MRACVCLYNYMPYERTPGVCGFWYHTGGTVLIHGFIFSNRGDA
jgi:hypothetical protein